MSINVPPPKKKKEKKRKKFFFLQKSDISRLPSGTSKQLMTSPPLHIWLQWLAETLIVSLHVIRKIAVVFISDELQKSLIHGLKELQICHNLQH